MYFQNKESCEGAGVQNCPKNFHDCHFNTGSATRTFSIHLRFRQTSLCVNLTSHLSLVTIPCDSSPKPFGSLNLLGILKEHLLCFFLCPVQHATSGSFKQEGNAGEWKTCTKYMEPHTKSPEASFNHSAGHCWEWYVVRSLYLGHAISES